MAEQRGRSPLSEHDDVSQRQRDQAVTGKIFVIAEQDIHQNGEMNGADQQPSLRRRQLPDHQAQHDRQQKGVDDHRKGSLEHEHLDQQEQPAHEVDDQQLRFGKHAVDRADRPSAAQQQQAEGEEGEIGDGVQFFVKIAACREVMDLPVGQHRRGDRKCCDDRQQHQPGREPFDETVGSDGARRRGGRRAPMPGLADRRKRGAWRLI